MPPRLLVVTAAFIVAPTARADEGFTPLFNGKDFAGWTMFSKDPAADPKRTWSVDGGVIKCTGKPNGTLATETEYADYVFRIQWRYPAGATGGNSGVLVHCVGPDKVWPNSVEAQMRAGRAGDLWLNPNERGELPKITIDPARFDAANKDKRHYWRTGKDDPVEKPFGEWNRFEITARGGDLTFVVNGKTVNTATGCELTRGRIALQSEGSPVEFKEIELKRLK